MVRFMVTISAFTHAASMMYIIIEKERMPKSVLERSLLRTVMEQNFKVLL
jgi:hypothetical protein